MRWFQALMPKEEGFVELFVAHAATLVDGAAALRKLLEGGPEIAAHCAEINRHEDAADKITAETFQALRRTFITPFDRIDIQDLSSTLDDAIDQMKKTAKAVTLFEVTEFQPQMREMGDIIVKAAALTAEAMPLMNKLGRNSKRLTELTVEIIKLEDAADAHYDAGLKALYQLARNGNAMDYIVGAEIYDHLEKVVDKFEDVANRISGILTENL